MTITISSNGVLVFLGIALVAWLAGNVGSAIGIIITALRTSSQGAKNLLVAAGMGMFTVKLQVVKIPIALIAAAVSLAFFPAAPVKVAAGVCAGLAAVVMLLIGLSARD